MLPLFALAALLASASAQELPASAVPASTYGPPAPIPEATALSEVDGTAYVPYPYGFSDPGFSVQTGYEGYLVPIQGHSVSGPATLGLLASLLPLPKLAIKLFPKISLFLAGFLFLLLIGGAFTTAVCAFTPFCTITFLGLGLRKSNMRSFLTKDRLTETTAFVLDAIDKYKDFTKKARRSVGSVKDSKRRRR